MFTSVDDITIAYEEEGVEVVKEIDKVILSKGAWSTILFRYQQWEPAKNAYSGDKYSIRRYRKTAGEYRQQSKFNISSRDQANQIADALKTWLAE